jgi:glycosyltransferase involved in cell wall biosynthesis
MRIAHVSTSDLAGGAARNTYRIHRALLEAGADSQLFVSEKLSDDPTVIDTTPHRWASLRRLLRQRCDELPLKLHPQRVPDFSLNWMPSGAWRMIAAARADIVHLHWINRGFLPLGALRRLGAPLVWSLLDHWPLTGGCHYSGDCLGFETACGRCPALRSSHAKDLSARRLRAKRAAWRGLSVDLVCFSQQSAEFASRSSLFGAQRRTVLPPPVDTRRFRPIPRAEARRLLELDEKAFVVAFGAVELDVPRKGFDLARAALAQFVPDAATAPVMLCTFGSRRTRIDGRIGVASVQHLGRLSDDLSVALLFSAADTALIPSREDTGPLLTVESLACGCPVVGFPVGTTADLVQHEVNGYLASAFDPAALAAGLHWAVRRGAAADVRQAARDTAVKQADATSQASRYLELYRCARAEPSPSG